MSVLKAFTDPQMTKKEQRKWEKVKNSTLVLSYIKRRTENEIQVRKQQREKNCRI